MFNHAQIDFSLHNYLSALSLFLLHFCNILLPRGTGAQKGIPCNTPLLEGPRLHSCDRGSSCVRPCWRFDLTCTVPSGKIHLVLVLISLIFEVKDASSLSRNLGWVIWAGGWPDCSNTSAARLSFRWGCSEWEGISWSSPIWQPLTSSIFDQAAASGFLLAAEPRPNCIRIHQNFSIERNPRQTGESLHDAVPSVPSVSSHSMCLDPSLTARLQARRTLSTEFGPHWVMLPMLPSPQLSISFNPSRRLCNIVHGYITFLFTRPLHLHDMPCKRSHKNASTI